MSEDDLDSVPYCTEMYIPHLCPTEDGIFPRWCLQVVLDLPIAKLFNPVLVSLKESILETLLIQFWPIGPWHGTSGGILWCLVSWHWQQIRWITQMFSWMGSGEFGSPVCGLGSLSLPFLSSFCFVFESSCCCQQILLSWGRASCAIRLRCLVTFIRMPGL